MTASQDKEAEPSNVLSEPILSSDDIDDKDYRYRDFSHVKEDDDNPDLQEDHTPVQSSPRGNSESSIRVQKFPVKLYVILAQKEFNDIVTWMPHGRSWKVLKPSLFESMVMPLFFEYSNYHSFNRLVNAWSFRRIGAGPDRGAYYHELFLRGLPHLQKYMRRLPKTHKKLPMDKKHEPDFYAMDKIKPLPRVDEAPIPGLSHLRNGTSAASATADTRDSPAQGVPINMPQQPPVVTPPNARGLPGMQPQMSATMPQPIPRYVGVARSAYEEEYYEPVLPHQMTQGSVMAINPVMSMSQGGMMHQSSSMSHFAGQGVHPHTAMVQAPVPMSPAAMPGYNGYVRSPMRPTPMAMRPQQHIMQPMMDPSLGMEAIHAGYPPTYSEHATFPYHPLTGHMQQGLYDPMGNTRAMMTEDPMMIRRPRRQFVVE